MQEKNSPAPETPSAQALYHREAATGGNTLLVSDAH